MSDQDMFKDENNTPQNNEQKETPSTPNPDPFADKLKVIKNEQGEPKYKDVDTALEALAASQQFIEQLKAENAEEKRIRQEREAELEKMGNIDDFVKKLNPNAAPKEKVETPPTPNGLSEEQIADLLQKQLDARDRQSQQMNNLQTVTSKLTEMYGDQSGAIIQKRAKELNTTPTQLKELASSNPAMALSLLGGVKVDKNAPSQSSVNLPHKPQDDNPMPKFEKGITRGGMTSKEMAERFRQSKEYTNKRIGVET